MAEPQLRYMPPEKVRQWKNPETDFVFRFFDANEFEEAREYTGQSLPSRLV